MTKNVEVTHLIGTLEYIGGELSNIANKPSVEINKEGVTPTETAETITIGDDSYSIGGGSGSYTVDVIMGDLDRTYGTTPANYIGTFNQWVDIDSGKSFSDYNEILLIMKPQANPTYGTKVYTHIVNSSLLQHYNTYAIYAFPEGGSTTYVRCGLDYTNNKFFLENFNYICPIALIGVKY